jgi:tRNA pseudouridine32 synthase/23S rRNA pseudouridine746 synthase
VSKLTEPGVAARLKSKRAHGQARALRKAMTPAEKALWFVLRQYPIAGSHWRKQAAMGPFIVDFVCHGSLLIVELDGGVHDAPNGSEQDGRRRQFLDGRGYRVLRFTNAEVFADVGLVVRTILTAAGTDPGAPPPLRGRVGWGVLAPALEGEADPPSSIHLPARGRGTQSDTAFARSFLIHEDRHMLVFNKPAGLAVQGGSGVAQSLEDMLAAFAKSNGKRPRLVHRLDRETSGIIVAARTKPAAAFLSQAFAERQAHKTYLALVCGGAPDPCEGEIALALKKASRKGLDIMEVSSAGQSALTRYSTIAAIPEAALLELRPETGRMHQLRAHLAAIGRPIAGDGKYGGLFRLGAAEVPGLMLHASALDLPHPDGGRRRFAAPAPVAFHQTLRSLGLEAALGAETC